MKVRLMAIVSASLILAGCAGSVKPDTVKAANGSAIDIYSVSALPELNDNRIADNTLREVTPTHAATGMGLAVLGALTGNINSGDFDKENYKGTAIETLQNPTNSWFVPKAKQNISKWLNEKGNALAKTTGKALLVIAPWLMKSLSVIGTLAMFLVGGGIVVHGIAPLHHAIEHFAEAQGAVIAAILPTLLNLVLGFIIGLIVVGVVKVVEKMRGRSH